MFSPAETSGFRLVPHSLDEVAMGHDQDAALKAHTAPGRSLAAADYSRRPRSALTALFCSLAMVAVTPCGWPNQRKNSALPCASGRSRGAS